MLGDTMLLQPVSGNGLPAVRARAQMTPAVAHVHGVVSSRDGPLAEGTERRAVSLRESQRLGEIREEARVRKK